MISHLATGGMAQIYLARQTGLGSFERHVVLKTILRERASDQRFVNMFLDEAKLAATLNHQNVAQVYEVDQADGAYFMAMEYVHGENARAILETSLRRGWTIPLELAVMIVSGAGAGLHHAHERKGKGGQPLNIVHRDVSPANIMVGYDGAVKVLDFGIAKAEERATKTVGGTIKGKYGYMAPEQCKGKPIDRRSDIFALGICLYELTTLRRAFKGKDDFETMKRIVAGDVVLPSVAVAGYPRELEAIILTAMANDPNQRFQTAQELIEALDAFAVRAKLTGSNTAMGRFMLQLFGSRREPWVDGGHGDRTEISELDVDNEKTTVVEPSHDIQRVGTAPLHPPPSAESWQSEQPRTGRAVPSNRQTPQSMPVAGSQAELAPPIRQTPAPFASAGPPQTFLVPDSEVSDVGAQPLIDDAKLGWETSPSNKRIQPAGSHAGATRLSTQASEDHKIRTNTKWLVFAILLVLAAGAAVAAISLEWVTF
ncbi:MAG: serine/threonine protein kinase [Myxococcota bacterium]|nr:serine/threonine protein kinase [Myxococcota bacterium]